MLDSRGHSLAVVNGQGHADGVAMSDPLARVLGLGRRAVRTGLIAGTALALLLHAAGAAQALTSPIEVRGWALELRSKVHDYLWMNYEVEVEKPPPALPEPPKEEKDEPVAAPVPKAVPTVKERDSNPPPPAAAQAGKILAQEPDPDAPVDLTGEGFVTGNGTNYAGGVTAADGTSTRAVRDRAARPDGVVGSKGNVPTLPVSGPDLSRAASAATLNWNCAFPPEADAEQIDYQTVSIVVTVRADGTPQGVKVLSDPGHGFGRAARQCALSQAFAAAHDRQGNSVLAATPPFTVKFTR